jgi:electron transfer flavoprotein alpha subunit
VKEKLSQEKDSCMQKLKERSNRYGFSKCFGVKENAVSGSEEVKNLSVANEDTKVISHEQSSGKLDLKEAEIVVSAGRG